MALGVLDTSTAQIIHDMQQRLDDLAHTRQYTYADWISVNVADLTKPISGETWNIRTSFDARDKFVIGDKVKIKYSGVSGYKYFYIVNVQEGTIKIYGGTDYVPLPTTDFEEFWYSKSAEPQGFPMVFEDTGIQVTFSSGYSYSIVSKRSLITMTGAIVDFTVDLDANITTSGSGNEISFEYPTSIMHDEYKTVQDRGVGNYVEVVAGTRDVCFVYNDFATSTMNVQKMDLSGGSYSGGGLQIDAHQRFLIVNDD